MELCAAEALVQRFDGAALDGVFNGFPCGHAGYPRGEAVIERLNRGIALLTDTRRQAVILDYTSRRLYRYDVFDFLHQHGQALLLLLLLFAALAVIAAQRIQAFRRQQDDKIRLMLDHA